MIQGWNIFFGFTNIAILGVTCYFIYRSLRSPVDAVKVGRQLNNEEEKDNSKRDLFLLLFSLRGNPVHFDFVRGLNEIDVVFEDTPSVLTAWHTHFRDLHDKGLTDPESIWNVGRIRLLSAMATCLGYAALNQTDIMQHYYPEGHQVQLLDDLYLRQDLVAYLKTSIEMNQKIIYRMDNPNSERQEPKDDKSA